MLKIALCNQKGGVGKSTTTYHLARAAVKEGLKVLVVDLDPQGNITSSLTAEAFPEDQAALADVLTVRANVNIQDVIVPGLWEGLMVAPTAGESLSIVRDELVVAGAGRENRLRQALENVSEDYDLCLIDCPPSLDQLTINGLTAADGVLIITQSKLWSANGLAKLLDSIEKVKEYYNGSLSVIGVVINQHEKNTTAGAHWLKELGQAVTERNIPLFDPAIPKRVAISDAVEASLPLDEYPSSASSELAQIYTDYIKTITGGIK